MPGALPGPVVAGSSLQNGSAIQVGNNLAAANDASFNAPRGYLQNPDGTITGPQGATYAPTGTLDANGNQIYQNVASNGHYTLPASGAATSPAPSTLAGHTPGSIVQANNAAHQAASKQTSDFFAGQGANVQPGVTFNGQPGIACAANVCVADQVINVSGRTSLPVPPGFTAYDLNGNRLTHIPLSQTGQAVVEIKTGGGSLSAGQTNVYPQVQVGTATGAGNNAIRAEMAGTNAPTPVTILLKDRP